jgi:hypothetical protein
VAEHLGRHETREEVESVRSAMAKVAAESASLELGILVRDTATLGPRVHLAIRRLPPDPESDRFFRGCQA